MAIQEKEYITITFDLDDGGTEEIEHIVEGQIEVNGRDYLVLCESENDENMVFFRYSETENGEPDLEPLESEEEADAVIDALREAGYQIEVE